MRHRQSSAPTILKVGEGNGKRDIPQSPVLVILLSCEVVFCWSWSWLVDPTTCSREYIHQVR